MAKARSKEFGRGALIILFTALVGVGTWVTGQQVRNVRDTSAVAHMTAKVKTVCVGRYLVDVPEHADISLSGEMITGFRIKTVEETEPDFHARLAAREAELRARGTNGGRGGEGGLIEARNIQSPRLVGRSLIYGRSRGYLMARDKRIDMESVSVEVHVHMGDLTFTLSAEGTDEASAKEAETLLERLRPRGEDEIPGVPGFCIWRGVFVEPLPEHKNEHAVFHLGLPDHPDMGLALSSIAGGHTDEGLLARAAVTDAEASPDEILRVTKLRSGKRSVNGIEGEEVLERVRELNFTTTYGFMWEALGVSDDPLQANLLLNMEAGTNPRPGGKPVGSSLHEDAVMEVWDRISSSIRPQCSARSAVCTQRPTVAARDGGSPPR